ncbi:uncharacterized protein LOC111057440 [Nilaparvata lugens]|uniref:uncharacterized protein LOC111057440 n=1 Tax=Nilaparvata lugens TaxID=108931 RepID=UPI00193DDACA|nr:uncharacterized protein LOC111057440 [Nilaparvata lugens]
MSSYYKQVCSNCSATESNNWKKVEELGTWVCSNCFDDIIAENASSDEEATSQITTRNTPRVSRKARICPPQTSSTHHETASGRRSVFKKKIPHKNTKKTFIRLHPMNYKAMVGFCSKLEMLCGFTLISMSSVTHSLENF